MKQHITKEQLDELNDKEKEKLRNWWFEHIQRTIRQDFPTLLSIGQMIEFLDDNKMWLTIERLNDGWGLFEDPRGRYDHVELCDALFEVVKEVLEDEKT